MTTTAVNNKRIAKNTLLLYVRMLFMMIISLYTSRVVLNALGVEDYGLYDVVGGVVAMFSAISGTVNAAISRFITFEIGTGDVSKLKKVFSTSVNLQIGMSILVVVLAETVGLWFLNNKIVIPEHRIIAANWCYQFSILTFIIGLLSTPYNAAIVAHERMSAFAYFAIFEAMGRLAVAWSIAVCIYDRLIFYAIVLAIFALVVRVAYAVYCKRIFVECTYSFVYDMSLLKQMSTFIGWAFVGVSAWALKLYGTKIIINIFFGPIVNAAQAIATQVEQAVSRFVTNFMMALNPQITKSYATGDRDYMFSIMYKGARFSFYILLLLGLPLFLNTDYILLLWLKNVPDHSVLFVQLSLLLAMVGSIRNPLVTAHIATGKIKRYQIVVSGIDILNIPVSYCFFSLGAIPESVLIVAIVISISCFFAGLIVLRGMIGLNVMSYIRNVVLNVLLVSLCATVIPILTKLLINDKSFLSFIFVTLIAICSTFMAEMYVGCTKGERALVSNQIKKVITKRL